MTILSFFTRTTIDEAFIFTMGASVKVSNNPIGFFGTGLKYAIAVTLRLNGEFTIKTQDKRYNFYKREEMLRGSPIEMIYCDVYGAEGVAFTTLRCPMTADYGKTWEPWMVLRELYSNTMDEDGEVIEGEYMLRKPVLTGAGVGYSEVPKEYTLITVDCCEVHAEWNVRNMYFLNKARTPIWKNDQLEVYAGRSTGVFYRGINVTSTFMPSELTYNLIGSCHLSEDRTLDSYLVGRVIINNITTCEDEGVLSTFFSAVCKKNSRENSITYYAHDHGSAEYMTALIEASKTHPDEMPNALFCVAQEHLRDIEPKKMYKEYEPTTEEGIRLRHCIRTLERANMNFNRYEVILSNDVAGMGIINFRHRIIFLNPKYTVQHADWKRATIETLIEEYVHSVDEAADRSRQMQESYNRVIYNLIKED